MEPVMEARILRTNEYERWNGFVKDSPQGTLFHTSYWLEASGSEFRIYGYFKGEELFAGMPVICYSSKILGFRLASHPALTPYLGIIFKNSNAKYVTRISDEKEIAKALAAKVKEDFGYIYFNLTPFSIDLQPIIWEGFSSNVRYTYLLNLDDMNKVWQDMDAKRRNDITRAHKDGISVEKGDFEQAFALVEKTFKRQVLEAKFKSAAFKYNEVLSKKNQCRSFIARNKDDKAIAAVYIVWDEKRCYYLLGGYDTEASHHGASAMAIWEAIKYTREELGLKEFDFEGSMVPAIEQFFRKFGGKLTPYYSVSWMSPSYRKYSHIKRLINPCLRIFSYVSNHII